MCASVHWQRVVYYAKCVCMCGVVVEAADWQPLAVSLCTPVSPARLLGWPLVSTMAAWHVRMYGALFETAI
jgi:hypothetical protein